MSLQKQGFGYSFVLTKHKEIMESNSVGKNLVYHRKLKGYTQEQLSESTTVTVRTIQRIEKGDVNPHLQTVKLLATALEIEVDDLLVLENPKAENIQKKWLLLLHSVPFLGFILPLANILLPLFLWIHKREDNEIYDIHGRKVINFQISMSLLYIFSLVALVTIEKWGFLLFIIVIPFSVLMMLINIITVTNSQKSYYPLAFPFLRKQNTKALKFLLFLIPSLLLMGSCNHQEVARIERLDGSFITKDSLTHKITQLMTDAHISGMAVTVFNGDSITYKKTFGYKNAVQKIPLNDSTNIYGGSYSKAVFGVLVMKLVEDGVIDLDTPLESYLPKKIYEYTPETRWHDNFSALKEDSNYSKITARMCLSHTTGFPNWRWTEPDQKLKVHGNPGSRYSYSGEGFVYLQVVLEKILKKGLEELAQELIFEPLGMKNSSYQWLAKFEDNFSYGHSVEGTLWKKDKDNEPRGGSTLETTANDYSKFLHGVLQKKILSETSWNELFKPQIKIRSIQQFGPLSLKDSTLNDDIQLSYGLGWGLFQTPYGKGAFKECKGDGFQHYSIVFPEANKGIMIMTNSDNGKSIYKALLEVALMDTYTPWKWGNHIPYDAQ